MPTFVLKPLVDCDTAQQMAVLEARNAPDVRAAMVTDHEISVNEHLAYIESLRKDDRRWVAAVLDDAGRAIGSVNLSGVDPVNQTASFGVFLSGEARGGAGASVLIALIDHAFGALGLETLYCEALATNIGAIRLYQRLGFAADGVRRSRIARGGDRIDLHLFSLTAPEWRAQRSQVIHGFDTVLDVRIEAGAPQPKAGVVDQIQGARARNNLNWMALLRLSVERHPDLAKPIIAEIMGLDAEINALTRKLVEE